MSSGLNNRSLPPSHPYNHRGKSNVSEYKISKHVSHSIAKPASKYLNPCSKSHRQKFLRISNDVWVLFRHQQNGER